MKHLFFVRLNLFLTLIIASHLIFHEKLNAHNHFTNQDIPKNEKKIFLNVLLRQLNNLPTKIKKRIVMLLTNSKSYNQLKNRINYFFKNKNIEAKIVLKNDFYFYEIESFKESLDYPKNSLRAVDYLKNTKYKMYSTGLLLSPRFKVEKIIPGTTSDIRLGDVLFLLRKEHQYIYAKHNRHIDSKILRFPFRKINIQYSIYKNTLSSIVLNKKNKFMYIKFWNIHPNSLDWYIKPLKSEMKKTKYIIFDFRTLHFHSSYARRYKIYPHSQANKISNYLLKWGNFKQDVYYENKYIDFFDKILKPNYKICFFLSKKSNAYSWMLTYLTKLKHKRTYIYYIDSLAKNPPKIKVSLKHLKIIGAYIFLYTKVYSLEPLYPKILEKSITELSKKEKPIDLIKVCRESKIKSIKKKN